MAFGPVYLSVHNERILVLRNGLSSLSRTNRERLTKPDEIASVKPNHNI